MSNMVRIDNYPDGMSHFLNPSSEEFWNELKARMGQNVADYFWTTIHELDEQLAEAPDQNEIDEAYSYFDDHTTAEEYLVDMIDNGEIDLNGVKEWLTYLNTQVKPRNYGHDTPTDMEKEAIWGDLEQSMHDWKKRWYV